MCEDVAVDEVDVRLHSAHESRLLRTQVGEELLRLPSRAADDLDARRHRARRQGRVYAEASIGRANIQQSIVERGVQSGRAEGGIPARGRARGGEEAGR